VDDADPDATLDQPPGAGLVRAAISGDGTRIATAGEGVIQIWDAKTGAMLSSEKSEGAVAALAYSGPLLAVARGSAVSIGGREVPTVSEVHTFALSHDGALLAAAGIDGGVRLFRVSDGARLFACRARGWPGSPSATTIATSTAAAGTASCARPTCPARRP
jgi:WD40 repeat protein